MRPLPLFPYLYDSVQFVLLVPFFTLSVTCSSFDETEHLKDAKCVFEGGWILNLARQICTTPKYP
jgi:hypothetical protein